MKMEEMMKELSRVTNLTGLKRSDIRIGSGSAMMFYGLRSETNDIDAAVPGDIFKKLMADKRFKVASFKSALNGEERFIVNVGLVDFHNEDDTADFDFKTKDIGGYRVDTPETILRFKQKMNRPKDQADIRLLKTVIGYTANFQ